jgi:hypothetical protein
MSGNFVRNSVATQPEIAIEEKSRHNLFVYIKGGILDLDIDDVQRRLEDEGIEGNLQKVKRPLYGMKIVGNITEGIVLFAEMFPSAIFQEYYFVDIDDESRLYIQEVDEGITMSMVCTRAFDEIDTFANLSRV